jgi:hypothetical protein
MWIVSATDMDVLAIISGEEKVHEFRSPACPDQMRSWLHIRRH